MCLVIIRNTDEFKENPARVFPAVAQEDIECWKVLAESKTEHLHSVVFGEQYILGQRRHRVVYFDEYREPTDLFRDKGVKRYMFKVNHGLHTFKRKEDAMWYISVVGMMLRTDTAVIVRCFIPKGSRYYEGVDEFGWGNYCSDTLRLETKVDERVTVYHTQVLKEESEDNGKR